MNQACDKNNLRRFISGDMQDNELIAFAEHLLICERCNAALAESFEDDSEAISPPAGFSESVLRKAKANSRSAFLKYCVKVSAAACFALVILFSGAFQIPYEIGRTAIDEEFIDQTSIRLEQFRDRLFFREDVNFEHSE